MTVSSRTEVARDAALMRFDGEMMGIFAAYDLTGSLRAAAGLTGCSHHTVARHVAARDAGQPIAELVYRGRFPPHGHLGGSWQRAPCAPSSETSKCSPSTDEATLRWS